MEIGSKLFIKKIKYIEPPKGNPFYLASLSEKIYNPDRAGNKWEYIIYNYVYLFNVDFELEVADFSLNVNEKDKYSFDNIANKDKSIVRVLDFKHEKRTMWRNGELVKNDYNQPIYKDVYYLKKIQKGTEFWQGEESKCKVLERKIDTLKLVIETQKKSKLEKNSEYKAIIRDLKSKITQLTRQNKKLEQIIDKQNKMVSDAKNSVKEANKQTMVVRRKNTIANNEIKKTLQKVEKEKEKLEKAKEKVKQIKKMKKDEIISNAEEFDLEIADI